MSLVACDVEARVTDGQAPPSAPSARRRDRRVMAKRFLDIVVAVAIAVAALPLVAVVILAIKLDSPGKVLFRQQRVGREGEPFELLKFRTMVADAERLLPLVADQNEADLPLFRIQRDPRCTAVGRVLRQLGLDELPQLWNVLRGDMSMVGPRPALPSEMAFWSADLHRRLQVRPGITGMWQISGSGRWARFEEYARLDLDYVDHWSLGIDLVILAKTLPSLVARGPRG